MAADLGKHLVSEISHGPATLFAAFDDRTGSYCRAGPVPAWWTPPSPGCNGLLVSVARDSGVALLALPGARKLPVSPYDGCVGRAERGSPHAAHGQGVPSTVRRPVLGPARLRAPVAPRTMPSGA
ncbi:hypothetical protein GCM10023323_22660 [Streptomyces thinghirensis]|uniref:Uncharacterized protein n=1 Tax=Streptomyces thinghirensis TaxID=551547 RepID=A0ABP9SZI3_9ACTN